MPWVKDSVGSGVVDGAVHPLSIRSKAMPAQKIFFIVIIRLSAKGTDGVMKPAVFRTFSKFVTISTESSVYYRTRGGEWRGCIAATPHCYMVRSSVKASTIGANK